MNNFNFNSNTNTNSNNISNTYNSDTYNSDIDVDLDISHYSIDELKTIFNLNNSSFVKENVDKSLILLLQDYSVLGQQNYIRFLRQARNKLLYYLDLVDKGKDQGQGQGQGNIIDDGDDDDGNEGDGNEGDGNEGDGDEEDEGDEGNRENGVGLGEENDGENEDDGENEEEERDEDDEGDEGDEGDSIGEKKENALLLKQKLKELNSTTAYIKNYLDDIYKTSHVPNRKYANQIISDENDKNILYENRLPIQQEYKVPVVRGQINPNLKNINIRIVNVDSSFRQDIRTSSSDFTVDLCEPLHKVISFSLFNFEIQHSWYAFDSAYGTNYFYCDNSLVTIPSGNYTATELVDVINHQLNTLYGGAYSDISFVYNPNQNNIKITNNSATTSYNLLFYDNLNNNILVGSGGSGGGSQDIGDNVGKINYNLGWLLGCRNFDSSNNLSVTIDPSSEILLSSQVDVYGTKYIYMVLDDFNNNYCTNAIVNVSDANNKLDLPKYFSYDLSLSNPIYFNNGKPSGLTQAQAHTVVEILAQRENKNYQNRDFGISTSNLFARIPLQIKKNYETIVYTNSTLQTYTRKFFGPVDIMRLRVSLYNDKGQLLDLHGQDYSFSLITEELYQY
jgi:hypothetical protein